MQEGNEDLMIYKISDVADRWGVTRQTVKREIEKGNLKSFTIGSSKKPQYRIKEEWIQEYENGSFNSSSEKQKNPLLQQEVYLGDSN